MPKIAAEKGAKLIIVNLQKTDLDDLCTIRIFGKTDVIMTKVMEHLNLEIPTFKLQRFLTIRENPMKNEIEFGGIDTDKTPVSFIQKGKISIGKQKSVKISKSKLVAQVQAVSSTKDKEEKEEEKMKVEIKFMGHYNEPNLVFEVPMSKKECMSVYALSYNPLNGTWEMKKGSDSKLTAKPVDVKNCFVFE
jgi:hypothetical protein